MAILLACGASGLWICREGWQRLTCPLPCPSAIAWDARRLAVLDAANRSLWTGQHVIHVDGGVETVLFWREFLLTLSGDTDCLTLLDARTGMRLITTPVGVYPQDMCLLPGANAVAVCGGADGSLRILALPELTLRQMIRLPGSVQRVTWVDDVLYVLCALEDDGLCCLLCRVFLRTNRWETLALWPGLPGAVYADTAGHVFAAASESLCGFAPGGRVPERIPGEFGLIRCMDSRGGKILITDPVMGRCSLMQGNVVHPLWEGEVWDAKFI